MLDKYLDGLKGSPDQIKVDLHMHSTASDGTWKPETLIENINRAGISLFALTDHDSTENVETIKLLARSNNLSCIPGVEVSSEYMGKNYHILGLGIDIYNENLQQLLKENREEMEKKDDEGIRCLLGKYDNISFEEYKNYVNNPERGGWKSLNYLIDRGLCKDYIEFFGLYKDQNPFHVISFHESAKVISVIKEAGGFPILAHPGAFFYSSDYRAVIEYMAGEGIMGLECYHTENKEEVKRYCIEYCNKHNLMITGGSDCHGEFVKGRCLGNPDIRLSQLRL